MIYLFLGNLGPCILGLHPLSHLYPNHHIVNHITNSHIRRVYLQLFRSSHLFFHTQKGRLIP